VKTNCLSGKFSGGQGTGVRQGTCGLSLDVALFLPGSEVVDTADLSGRLNPLKDLGHRDEVHVVLVKKFIDPLQESVKVLGIELEPGGMEIKTQGGPVGLVMSLEVMVEEVVELFARDNIGAGVHHRATGKFFVERWVITTIEFVHHHLPDGVRSGRTILAVTVTSVWHTEVKGVWPKWRVRKWRRDCGIVEEGLFLHHEELGVSSHPEVWRPDADNGVVGDVGETFHDETDTRHLLSPILSGSLGPILLVVLVGDGVGCHFVSLSMHLLDSRVVGVLVGDEEC